jgi:hypothetical protein
MTDMDSMRAAFGVLASTLHYYPVCLAFGIALALIGGMRRGGLL